MQSMQSMPKVRIIGPLEPYGDGFGAELSGLGYTPGRLRISCGCWRI